MLLKNFAIKTSKNVENEQVYYNLINSYYKTLNCNNNYCNGFFEFKKIVKYFVKYISFLKRKNKNNIEYIMTLIHDVKSPITGIDYALRNANRNELTDDIYFANKSVLVLIEELLSEYSFLNDFISLKIEEVNLENILNECIASEKFLISANQIIINKKINICCNIFSDKNAIKRVFLNLISNAVKYAEKKSILEIVLSLKKDMVMVRIKNKKKQNSVFKKKYFEKFETNSHSNGLGLYICTKILKKLQGKITYKNLKNTLEFNVYLPFNLNKTQ